MGLPAGAVRAGADSGAGRADSGAGRADNSESDVSHEDFDDDSDAALAAEEPAAELTAGPRPIAAEPARTPLPRPATFEFSQMRLSKVLKHNGQLIKVRDFNMRVCMTPAELRDRTAGLNWRRPSVDGGASAQSRETLRAISSAPHCVLLNCLSDYWYGFATLGDFHSMARSLPTRDPALFGVVAGQQMPSFVFFLGRDLLATPSGVLSMVSGLTVIHHKFPQTPFIYLGAVHARYAAGTKLVDCPMDGYPDWLKPLVPEFANLRCLLWCNHHKGLLYSCTADLLIMNKDNYRGTPEDNTHPSFCLHTS